MNVDTPILLYAAVFAAAAAFVAGFFYLVAGMRGGAAEVVDRRLDSLSRKPWGDSQLLLRRKSLGQGKSPWLAKILQTASLKTFDGLVSTSGVGMSTERILFLSVIGTAVIFEVLEVVLGFGFASAASSALLLGVAAPLALIVRIRRRRLARITAQLPDAIDMLVRSMRAGHPIATGVGLIAREMSKPISAEFASVYDEMSYGMDLRHAFEKMSQRLPIVELSYMIAAMRIQSTTGGNLAEVLAALSNVMREKVKLRAKVQALSAEARFSGVILAALPILVVIALVLLNPHYYDLAATSVALKSLLVGAGGLTLLGIYLVRKIVNIRI